MSARLDIPLEDLDGLARQSLNMVELGSFCTVFSATEVLEKIRQGKKVPDIVKGLFFSVIKRVPFSVVATTFLCKKMLFVERSMEP